MPLLMAPARIMKASVFCGAFVIATIALTRPVQAGERTTIGERINFSGDEGAELPQRNLGAKQLSKPLEFLDRENSFGGVTEPFIVPFTGTLPQPQPSPRLWELFEQRMEQKKNWVYTRPDDWGRQPELEGALGRESTVDFWARKPRGSLAAFFEEGDQHEKNKTRRKEGSMDDPIGRNSGM